MDEDDPQIADRIEAHTLEYGSVAEQKREIAVDLFVGNNIIPSAWCPYQNMSTDQLTRLIAEKTGHKARKCSITMTPENCQAEAVRQVNREFDCHEQVFVDIEPVTQPRNRQSEQELIVREREHEGFTRGYTGLRPGRLGYRVYARLGRRGYGGLPRVIPRGISEHGRRGFC